MKKQILLWILSLGLGYASFDANISPINPETKQRMIAGNSWRKGCPVSLRDLRYIRLTHRGFDGRDKQGELIVHKAVASEIVSIFRGLYDQGYPIRQMRLVSDFHGKDWHSIEADNTSAYNCRNVGGTKRWSKHSYGKAIDINPIENPYISSRGRISHKASLRYRKRRHQSTRASDRAILLSQDRATKIFVQHGWRWGGTFRGEKDYQHFAK